MSFNLPLGSLKSRYLDIPDDITANRTSFMVCRSKTKINNHKKENKFSEIICMPTLHFVVACI
jgi:hypothetical protein